MKRLFTLFVLVTAFIGNAMAWEPVIKERHWFGVKEFEEELFSHPGVGPVATTLNCVNNELMSITLNRDWSNDPTNASSFNCWMDDSGDSPKPRFKFNNSGRWDIGKNNNSNYTGYGLRVNVTEGDPSGGSIINIQHLNNGDKIVLEMYCQTNDGNYHQPILMNGSVSGVSAYGYDNSQPTWPDITDYDIGNPNGVSNEYTYTGNNDGSIGIRIPQLTVIRCITIIYNNYKTATTKIERIEDAQNNVGYKMTITGSGVLEDKRGAVPYITMRYGAENDMTFSRFLGTVNGVKQYGTSSIVDESEPLLQGTALSETLPNGSNTLQLQSPYRQRTEAQNKKSLVGKEWTVFTGNEDLQDPEGFNSIYPLYGNYYYFFPEVDGKFRVRFYCEGGGEHMSLWYKLDNGTPVTLENQVLANTYMSTDNGNTWEQHNMGGDNTLNTNYYEYTADFKKGGVYYLCSNPTIQTQQSPIPRLISYSFIPEFRLDPLWYVATDEEKEAKAVNNASTLNQDFTVNGTKNIIKEVKCLGNIDSAEAYFVADNANNKAYLNFRNIVYKSTSENDPTLNDGGAVVVTVECEEGKAKFVLTIPYSAEKAVASTDNNNHYQRVRDTDATRNPNGKEVKKWDFFSQVYEVGQYSNPNSQLYKEIHKSDGLTADWVETYVNVEKNEEPIFKSVYDMEGDNADMLHETNGLVFFSDANVLGIYNENNPSTTSFADRYIGLMNGGEFWIPNLKAGDRVVIKMGVYGKSNNTIETQNATLHIENAQDAVGKPLSSGSGDNIQYYDYVIGGSGVAAGNDLNNGADINDPSQPWGEYHFISTGGHFKLKVAETTELLKIYSIVIYKNSINPDNILTENELLGDEEHLQILNTQDFTTAVDEVLLHMHYRGLNEDTNYAQKKALTGNLMDNDISRGSQTSDNSLWYTFSVNSTDELPITPDKAKFGVFRARLGVQTIGNGDYVTDYADAMIPVGYRETKTYPYTWDFTDLKKYVTAGIDNNGVEKEVADVNADLRIWNNWNLRVAPEEWDGNIFASGGQLYGGKTMFDETRGIGITYDNNNDVTTMTGTSTDETGGLAVNGEGTYGFIVPQVDNGQAIYVRAAKVGSTQSANYTESKGYPTYTYEGQGSKAFPYSAEATDGSGDWVFALVMQNKNDVRLNFKGYEVKKIAVATDSKKVNIKGYASESRDHAIDASLLPYFTGKNLKTYVVSNPDYTARTLTLTDVGAEDNCVIPASTGCIIYNTSNGEFNPFGTDNKGFHLFVPDMHDSGKTSTLDNLLVANVDDDDEGKGKLLGMFDGDKTNYALTYRYQMLKEDGTPYGDVIEGDEMFYRVSNKGIKLHKNSAYLQLPTSEVKPSPSRPAGCPMFSFIFTELDEGETVITGIEEAGVLIEDEEANAVWYNLNGQKLNGKPSARGIYIRNGKKVFVK